MQRDAVWCSIVQCVGSIVLSLSCLCFVNQIYTVVCVCVGSVWGGGSYVCYDLILKMCKRDTCKDWRQKYSHAYKRDLWKLWHSTLVCVHYNISVCAFAFECQVVTQKSHTRGSCQHISIGRVDSMRESFCQTVSMSVQCKRKRLEGFLIYCSLLKKSPFWTGSIAQEN